jgi:hypothetical protein
VTAAVAAALTAWHYFGLYVTVAYWVPAPKFSTDLFWANYVYWAFTATIVGVVLPAVEELFWRVFVSE